MRQLLVEQSRFSMDGCVQGPVPDREYMECRLRTAGDRQGERTVDAEFRYVRGANHRDAWTMFRPAHHRLITLPCHTGILLAHETAVDLDRWPSFEQRSG